MGAIGVGEKSATVLGATFQVIITFVISFIYRVDNCTSKALCNLVYVIHSCIDWMMMRVESVTVVFEGFYWHAWGNLIHFLPGICLFSRNLKIYNLLSASISTVMFSKVQTIVLRCCYFDEQTHFIPELKLHNYFLSDYLPPLQNPYT